MSKPPRLIAIAALASRRVIGRGGAIPWHISDELRWFKAATTGHTVLMGRKTFDSLKKPLPNRRNLVVTRGPEIAGVTTIRGLESFDPAAHADPGKDVFVIGGAAIYEALLSRCEELWLTLVPLEVDGDAYFPPFEPLFDPAETLLAHPEFEVRRYVRKG